MARKLGGLLLLACFLATPAAGGIAEGNDRLALPGSHLEDPFETPVFVTGHAGLGGGYEGYDPGLGYGGSVIFRPGHPVNLLGTLFRRNVGTVAQVDHQRLKEGGSWTAVDLVARGYLLEHGSNEVPVTLFLGLGTGGAFRTLEGAGETGDEAHWTWLVEAGQEWFFRPTHMIFVKGQYRWIMVDENVGGQWSVQMGVGIRWPW